MLSLSLSRLSLASLKRHFSNRALRKAMGADFEKLNVDRPHGIAGVWGG